MAQLSFTGRGLKRPSDRFGGSLLKGNPKTKRPLESKLPIHLVLRSSQSTLRRPEVYGKVQKIIHQTAVKYRVKIFDQANVGNHLHLGIQITKLKLWPGFIRELTSRIAAVANRKSERFWLYRPFTRIIRSWQKAFRSMLNYIYLNQLEADGYISRREIKTFKHLKMIFGDTA